MAVTEPLIGKFVNLRCVEVSDAKFTLEIRNDPELTKYIPKVNGTATTQEAWIAKQRLSNDDYFFIIENKYGEPIGTIGCYDINFKDSTCETGRFISRGEVYENIEASLMMFDLVFDKLQITYIVSNVDERNKKVVSLNRKFGAVYNNVVEMNGWNSLSGFINKKNYVSKREKISKLLEQFTIK